MDDPVLVVSLTSFAAAHQLALTRFAYLLCGDAQRAEDLVQDVFMAAFRRFGDALPVEHPVAYMRAAVVNRYISRRRLRISGEATFGLEPTWTATVDSHDAGHADRDLVWRAMSRLGPRQRAVVVLRFYADMSDADIAAVLGCRVGTVSSATSRAMSVLRKDPTLVEAEGDAR